MRDSQVISTARTCNLILIILDSLKPLTHKRIIEKELEVGTDVPTDLPYDTYPVSKVSDLAGWTK